MLSAFAPTTKASETTPTQTPSAPTRSEEAHRVGASRRAILSRDGLTLTRRRPSRREMRACGASSRKRPRRPGVAQAVAVGVNSPRGSIQNRPSLSSVGRLVEATRASVVNSFAVRARCYASSPLSRVGWVRLEGRVLVFKRPRGALPLCEDNGRQEEAENGQYF